METLKLGELFAGYGGLGLAVQEAFGAEVSWVSEIEPDPSRVLAYRFPHAPNLGDITKINWHEVEPVDILSGGFPCQDVSLAGNRAGLIEGTRSGLWGKFAEGISILRPKYVVAENVRGLLSAKADSRMEPCPSCMGVHNPGGRKPAMRALGAVLGDLADLGYDAQWTTIRASDVGACHQRERVVLLAVNQAPEDTFGGDGREGFSDPGNQAARENRSDFSDKPGGRRDGSGPHQQAPADSHGVGVGRWGGSPRGLDEARSDSKARQSSGGANPTGSFETEVAPHPEHDGHSGATSGRGDRATTSSGRGEPQAELGEPEGGHTPHSGSGSVHSEEVNWGAYAAAIRRWEQVFGYPCPRPTRPIGPEGAERLSSEFVEWMMGLEPGWVTDPRIWEGVTDKKGKILEGRKQQLHAWKAQIKMLGNGVHPLQVSTALKQLLLADMLS